MISTYKNRKDGAQNKVGRTCSDKTMQETVYSINGGKIDRLVQSTPHHNYKVAEIP